DLDLEAASEVNISEPLAQYKDNTTDEYKKEGEEYFEEEFSLEEYIQDGDYKDYGTNYNSDDEEEHKEIPIPVQYSIFEKLQNQLDLLPLTDKEYLIGNQIIGSLDDDGYLRRPILSLIDDL